MKTDFNEWHGQLCLKIRQRIAWLWVRDNWTASANRIKSLDRLNRQPVRMTVTIVDRDAMDALWGTSAFRGVVLLTVTIDPLCPVCKRQRGKPKKSMFHEFGEHYAVDTWNNPCGHVDKYSDVLLEAAGEQQGSKQ